MAEQSKESQAIDSIIATMKTEAQKNLQNLKSAIQGLATADADKNGELSSAEQAAYYKKMMAPSMRAALSQLDCQTPEQDALAKIMAETASISINRTLAMVKEKKPGLGAKALVDAQVNKMAGVVEAMLDAQGSNEPGLSPITLNKFSRAVEEIVLEADKAYLARYEAMVKKGEIGNLPRQALPMTAKDFCGAVKR